MIMAKNRVTTHLACEACKERNYTQVVAKKRTIGSLNLISFVLVAASIMCIKRQSKCIEGQ